MAKPDCSETIKYREERGVLHVEVDLTRPEYVTRVERRLMLGTTHGKQMINPETWMTLNVCSQRTGFNRVDLQAARSAWFEIMAQLYGKKGVG